MCVFLTSQLLSCLQTVLASIKLLFKPSDHPALVLSSSQLQCRSFFLGEVGLVPHDHFSTSECYGTVIDFHK